MRISDVSDGRDNNLNLIRMAAALGVLVSHAWPLTLGPGAVQPLKLAIGQTLGTICVYIFFAISGFLIAASYDRARSNAQFISARVLRLVPGLFVSVTVVALVMGPFVTTLPLGTYLSTPDTWLSILRNVTMIRPEYNLPGVFETNPYVSVQGSIWTLIHEVFCYVGIFAVGIAGILRRRGIMSALLVAYVLAWVAIDLRMTLPGGLVAGFVDLSLPFAMGTALYLWRYEVPMSATLAGASLIAAGGLSLVLGLDHTLYHLALVGSLTYVTFWLAFVPKGKIRAYNQLGDYSYGVYIYAFPLQGLMVWLMPGQTPLENILWSVPVTLIPSILSWHLVEKPALDWRKSMTQALSRNRV